MHGRVHLPLHQEARLRRRRDDTQEILQEIPRGKDPRGDDEVRDPAGHAGPGRLEGGDEIRRLQRRIPHGEHIPDGDGLLEDEVHRADNRPLAGHTDELHTKRDRVLRRGAEGDPVRQHEDGQRPRQGRLREGRRQREVLRVREGLRVRAAALPGLPPADEGEGRGAREIGGEAEALQRRIRRRGGALLRCRWASGRPQPRGVARDDEAADRAPRKGKGASEDARDGFHQGGLPVNSSREEGREGFHRLLSGQQILRQSPLHRQEGHALRLRREIAHIY